MAADDKDLIARIKKDNTSAQLAKCGSCRRPMAMNKGTITEANLVKFKNKKRGGDNKAAVGFLCDYCLEDKMIADEGPRVATYIDPRTDQISETYYDNLVDFREPSTVPVTTAGSQGDKEVFRSTTTGKLIKKEK